MPKKKISTERKEFYQQLERQVKKINFLLDVETQLKEESLLSPSLEREFIENDLAGLFSMIKTSSNEKIMSLLENKLSEEEIVLNNLVSNLSKVHE